MGYIKVQHFMGKYKWTTPEKGGFYLIKTIHKHNFSKLLMNIPYKIDRKHGYLKVKHILAGRGVPTCAYNLAQHV